jgi:hypothetical protein
MTKTFAQLTALILVSLVTAVVLWKHEPHSWWVLLAFWPIYIWLVGFIVIRVRQSRYEKQRKRALEWPETQGTVTTSVLELAHVEVRYKYSVSGREYDGKYEISLTPLMPSRDLSSLSRLGNKAKSAMAAYPKGASLSVRYNPNNPADSILFSRLN